MLITPNPATPGIQVDNVDGHIRADIDQSAGTLVVVEVKATGNLYQVPAGKTFTGVAVLMVGTGAGLATIVDGSSNVLHSCGGAAKVPANPAIVSVAALAGGGGGNQTSVAEGGSGQLISAVLAGYVK
jgi:hypothetical protein